MADLNAVLTRLNDRLLRLEGELFVLRSLARATLTAGDDHAARMRKLVEAAKVALDDEAKRELDKPTRKYVDAATALVEELLVEPTAGASAVHRHRRRPARLSVSTESRRTKLGRIRRQPGKSGLDDRDLLVDLADRQAEIEAA